MSQSLILAGNLTVMVFVNIVLILSTRLSVVRGLSSTPEVPEALASRQIASLSIRFSRMSHAFCWQRQFLDLASE